MIIKGGAVGGGGLGGHLEKEDNESVELLETDGLLSTDIEGVVAELRARGAGLTRKPVFHFAVSAQPGQKWGEAEQRAAVAAVLKEFRADGVPYAIVRHQKDINGVGRDCHLHILISRIDNRGRVVNDGFTRVRNEKVARIIEYDLGHPLTVGKHNKAVTTRLKKDGREDVVKWMADQKAEAVPRPTAKLSHAEAQQETRTNIKKADVATSVLAAFRAADCGQAFQAALADNGYRLAKGREAGFVMVVDPAGGSHELTRLLRSALKAEGEKLPAKEVRAQIDAKLGDLRRYTLPDLAEVVVNAREGQAVREETGNGNSTPVTNEAGLPTVADIIANLTREKATFSNADVDHALKAIENVASRNRLKADVFTNTLIVADGKSGWRGTTSAMAEIEASILDRTEAMVGRRSLAVDAQDVAAGIRTFATDFKARTGYDVNGEQIDAIRQVTTGADVVAVTGIAGSGKTTMTEGAVRIWKAAGDRIEGMALSGKAAIKLAEAGIASDTIHSRLARWDRAAMATELLQTGVFTTESKADVLQSLEGWKRAAEARGEPTESIEAKRGQVETAERLSQLDRSSRRWINGWLRRHAATGIDANTIVVVDEAGMVNHAMMARILDHAHRAGAKVVLIGDAEQIQPIEAGSAFRLVCGITETAELHQVIRQREDWQRSATEAFSSGSPEKAVEAVTAYADHGMIHAGIFGLGSNERLYAEAAEKLGRELTDVDRQHIDQVAAYAGARVEAGALWREIQDAGGEVKDHPLCPVFKDAQERRNSAVTTLAGNLDNVRPWLARYQIDPNGFAADLSFAEGARRTEAEATAADRAEALELVGLEPDVTLSFDWRAGAREALFEHWRSDLEATGPAVSRIILTYTRTDVARLNADARAAMRTGGYLSGPDVKIETESGEMLVAVGDRIMTLANDRKVGVQNGTSGQIEQIDHDPSGAVLLAVATDDGREVVIDTSSYSALQHGYAATLHKSQGVTVDRAWLLNHGMIDRHLAYVAMSRHRDAVQVYSAAIDGRTTEALARQYSRGRTKTNISDYRDPRELLRRAVSSTEQEQPHVRTTIGANRRSDAGTSSRTLRQFDALADSARSTPRRADRVRNVPRLNLACDEGRSALLLRSHAAHQLDKQRSGNTGDLRRADVRPEAAVTPIPTGEKIMAGVTATAQKQDQDLTEWRSIFFDPTLEKFRALAAIENRTDDQTEWMEAWAASLRSAAFNDGKLRQWVPDEADKIIELADKHDRESGGEDDSPHEDVNSSTENVEHFDFTSHRSSPGNEASKFELQSLLNKIDKHSSDKSSPEYQSLLSRISKLVENMPREDAVDLLSMYPSVEEDIYIPPEHIENMSWQDSFGDTFDKETTGAKTTTSDYALWKNLQAETRHIKDVEQQKSCVDITTHKGQTLQDHGSRIVGEDVTRQTADLIARAAVAKGWTSVHITGTAAEKQMIAEAMIARGVAVSNPELKQYCANLDKAHELATDRAALAAARLQPDLTDPQKFATALSAYQHALVSGATPDQIRDQWADVTARGEAINKANNDDGMTETAAEWAAEAATLDAALASEAAVETA
jgi:ATP-dependent exoDNAse (exonuclease V) alpha subunit